MGVALPLTHAQTRFLDTKHDHPASQSPGITQHPEHTVGPIEECTAKTRAAKLDGTNARRCRGGAMTS